MNHLFQALVSGMTKKSRKCIPSQCELYSQFSPAQPRLDPAARREWKRRLCLRSAPWDCVTKDQEAGTWALPKFANLTDFASDLTQCGTVQSIFFNFSGYDKHSHLQHYTVRMCSKMIQIHDWARKVLLHFITCSFILGKADFPCDLITPWGSQGFVGATVLLRSALKHMEWLLHPGCPANNRTTPREANLLAENVRPQWASCCLQQGSLISCPLPNATVHTFAFTTVAGWRFSELHSPISPSSWTPYAVGSPMSVCPPFKSNHRRQGGQIFKHSLVGSSGQGPLQYFSPRGNIFHECLENQTCCIFSLSQSVRVHSWEMPINGILVVAGLSTDGSQSQTLQSTNRQYLASTQ